MYFVKPSAQKYELFLQNNNKHNNFPAELPDEMGLKKYDFSFCSPRNVECTEVGRAPLIHFQKGFLYIKIGQMIKFYAWIIM